MSPKSLLEPILENGIKNTNFFEGRLLSGRDLREQQAANQTHYRHLGRAIGAGVIEGLEVEVKSDGTDGSQPILKVKQGLAITAMGDMLKLPQDEDIVLTRSLEVIEGKGPLFHSCLQPPTASIPNGAGIYILVMSPASGSRERAPKSGLGDQGIVKGCGSRYIVEGVQFRLVEMNPASLDSITPETRDDLLLNDLLSHGNPASISEPDRLSKLQNILAHLCFGTEILSSFAADPFAVKNNESAYINYNAIDDLHRLELLNDCDVPLALFYWTLDGIAFLDLWSVRRRPHELIPSNTWPTLISPLRLAETEAMFFQFQEQLNSLKEQNLSQNQIESIEADDYYRYLPAVGILPITGINKGHGFDYPKFFSNCTTRNPVFIEGYKVNHLLHKLCNCLPIDLNSKELIWLYIVRENKETASTDKQPDLKEYILFVNAHIPYQGNARFDINRWGYSNYAMI